MTYSVPVSVGPHDQLMKCPEGHYWLRRGLRNFENACPVCAPAVKACLHCEGRGVVRDYINNAGEYNVRHCTRCQGTGRTV